MGNYGWAIIFVTVFIKLLLVPLSIKQTISSKKMQKNMAKLKPQLDELKESFNKKKTRHKDDPVKLAEIEKDFQQKTLALYHENGGFNPLSGCLPTLMQLPIIIALYWTFYGSPFQPSVLVTQLEASERISTEAGKNAKSNIINFVDNKGNLGRYIIESNIPSSRLIVNQEYKLELKKISGDSDLQDSYIFWKLGSPKDKARNLASLTKEKLEKLELPTWANGIINLENTSTNINTPTEIKIKASKPIDNFNLEVFMLNSRGKQSFLFIRDLGRTMIWDSDKREFHYDMAVLLVLFVVTMIFGFKASSAGTQMPAMDDNQEKMQKQMQYMLPLMSISFFLFFPVPAAVFLYLVISNLFQYIQTQALMKFLPVSD